MRTRSSVLAVFVMTACTTLSDQQPAPWMYFVHSYAAAPAQRKTLAATTRFGDRDITAMVWQKRLGACQFHPEFTSRPRGGHPLFTSYITAALERSRAGGVTAAAAG